MDNKGFEFSFTWLFVVLIGMAILFVALYVSGNILKTSNTEYQTRTAAELGALLHPLETSLATQASYTVRLPQETRIYNKCSSSGTFGVQEIRTSVRSGLGEEWPRAGEAHTFSNKYLFSNSLVQAKELSFFVIPLEMPYKVGDIIVLYDRQYCFVSPPRPIQEDIESLGMKMINVTDSKGLCPQGSVSVCFDGSRCDVQVRPEGDGSVGSVVKNRTTADYYGPLVYAAIFSEGDLYNCQLMRMRARAAHLAELYEGKSGMMASRGCNSGLDGELRTYGALLLDDANTIKNIGAYSDTLGRENELLNCRLF